MSRVTGILRTRRFPRLLLGRVGVAVLQAGVITTAVFFLLRLLPGDPSFLLAGPSPTEARLEQIRRSLRLDQPLPDQFVAYVGNLLGGDWGRSIVTGNNVLVDIAERLPATIELITVALLVSVLVAVPWAVFSAMRPRSTLARLGSTYGRLSGSVPDFWVATLLVLVLFTWLRIAPPPIGRLDIMITAPPRVTGLLTVDALIAGRADLLPAILARMVLPVLSLVAVVCSVFYKQTRAGMERQLSTGITLFAEACGLPDRRIARIALRNALPPVVATVGNTYAYLMGGAVLIEAIFSWGGMGQYAVQAVQASDYFAVTGVVLVASLFTLMIYLAVDVANALLDPRTRR